MLLYRTALYLGFYFLSVISSTRGSSWHIFDPTDAGVGKTRTMAECEKSPLLLPNSADHVVTHYQ